MLRSLHEITIELSGAGAGTVENHGLIKAPSGAIIDGIGDIEIVNTGRIAGSVEMGGGSDTIDTRKGTVTGIIIGDTGNDQFWIGKSKVTIQEEMDGGYDYIHSTISYKLGDNLDSLELLGKKNLNGTANAEHNYLAGNAGNNVLKGMAGNDVIVGGKGNDRLFSGEDLDTFRFAKGDGHDTIEDFMDKTDLLTIDGVYSQGDVDALVIDDVKGGVVIEYAGGEIFLKGMKAVDITIADFNL
ncbi:MAG: hemolysin-type calcium-binding repeat family protein [Rhizobium sp.]|nr:hemolysin-type calcium-binding repeat family protein [Rhizobium sp.]